MRAERGPACPICRRAADPRYQPFCSQRCADVDLGRWLNERYVIPDPDEPDEAPHDAPPEADPER